MNTQENSTVSHGPRWVSDEIAETLKQIGIDYVSLNPGASFRGLHDSLVHGEQSGGPRLLLCLHEEHAVAIAHGYAKVAGEPMAVALHANVGLMHASMAVFDAWSDRVPMLILGGNGPMDSAHRRPWIDGVHTVADQAAPIRHFIKWDDQPTSLSAVRESLLRANFLTRTYPHGPVYISLDSELQETRISDALSPFDETRYLPPRPPGPHPQDVASARKRLREADRAVILIGRVGKDDASFRERVRLAELTGARVIADLNTGVTFPFAHPALVKPASQLLSPAGRSILQEADLILSLDWIDLGATLRDTFGDIETVPAVIDVSMDETLWNGWSKDHGGFAPSDVRVFSHPDEFVRTIVHMLERNPIAEVAPRPGDSPDTVSTGEHSVSGALSMEDISRAFERAMTGEFSFVRLPIGWSSEWMQFANPLDFLGYDGGGGVGSGPGMAVGSALALTGSDRLPIAVLGDGDTSMGLSALWTAAHHAIPLLVVVANNQTYMRDVGHQGFVANARGRDPENRWVAQQMVEPEIDFASLARGFGLIGHGPVTHFDDLVRTLTEAIAQSRAGSTVVVDVRITAE